ncbi:MAG TPA: hypothetical protein RMH99_03775 [Sandaracinaceae bacterium LLY-WYZ-13_1]|nr:hypothetical protein [Sandaracinaceae bacterium LLY-WYZ-13_1]
MPSRFPWALLCVSIVAGCAEPSWVDDPVGMLPERLSEVGIYPDPSDLDTLHDRAVVYAPVHPLWSNGSAKHRALLLPEGATIDNTEPERWRFPVGTLFFKTFSFDDGPVETRVIRRTDEGWEYAAYRWDESGSDATRLDIARDTSVQGRLDGELVDHAIPSERQCRTCHESNETVVIGFEELQLGARMEALASEGVFAVPPPDETERVRGSDAQSTEVLGYLQGNCVHCHNGVPGPANSFDMRHEVALGNLIEVPTGASAAEAGIRVVPGEPEESVLFRSFTGMNELPMPPVGVQHRDARAVEMFRVWIAGLE